MKEKSFSIHNVGGLRKKNILKLKMKKEEFRA
jgi:hypothetical protein